MTHEEKLAAARMYYRDKRDYCKRHHLCYACMQKIDEGGTQTHCSVCRARAKEWGRCSICCKNKPEPGYKTCRECRIKISEYNYQRRLRRMKDGTDNSDNTQNGTLDG